MPEIDAEKAWADGALEATVKGNLTNRRQQGRADLIGPEVVLPVVRLSERLRKEGKAQDCDRVLSDSYHAGVDPSAMSEQLEAKLRAEILAEAPRPRPEPPTPGPGKHLPGKA